MAQVVLRQEAPDADRWRVEVLDGARLTLRTAALPKAEARMLAEGLRLLGDPEVRRAPTAYDGVPESPEAHARRVGAQIRRRDESA
jgi:hypothetical protein